MRTVKVGHTFALLFILASAVSCMCLPDADARWPSIADLKSDSEASYVLSQAPGTRTFGRCKTLVRLNRGDHSDKEIEPAMMVNGVHVRVYLPVI